MDQLGTYLITLGLSPEATLQEAEAAYRDLVRVWHPDRFVSDPKLRAKAEEQPVRINQAIKGAREALRRTRRTPQSSTPTRQDKAQSQTPMGRNPSPEPLHSHPTLVIHQPLASSLRQTLLGCAMLYLGVFLVYYFSEKSGPQTALGLLLGAYGFSLSLLTVAILCLKTPIIAVNSRSLLIIGSPIIPILEVIDAHVLVSTRGTSLSISCSPEYIRQLPMLSRLRMRARHFIRGCHFELNSTQLSDDPTCVIRMIDSALNVALPEDSRAAPPHHSWGAYANAAASLCLAVAVLRCLGTSDYQFTSLLPYLVLFALLRIMSIVQTTVLAQRSRYPSHH